MGSASSLWKCSVGIFYLLTPSLVAIIVSNKHTFTAPSPDVLRVTLLFKGSA